MWANPGEDFTVTSNGVSIPATIIQESESYTILGFSYSHGAGLANIDITAPQNIPEFPIYIVVYIFMIVTGGLIVIKKWHTDAV